MITKDDAVELDARNFHKIHVSMEAADFSGVYSVDLVRLKVLLSMSLIPRRSVFEVIVDDLVTMLRVDVHDIKKCKLAVRETLTITLWPAEIISEVRVGAPMLTRLMPIWSTAVAS